MGIILLKVAFYIVIYPMFNSRADGLASVKSFSYYPDSSFAKNQNVPLLNFEGNNSRPTTMAALPQNPPKDKNGLNVTYMSVS